MPQIRLSADNTVFYDYKAPASATGVTVAFFNALSADHGLWEAEVAPALRDAGHGTLLWDYRGQAHSSAADDLVLNADLIVADATRLLAEVKPERPLWVGLSIGGLFAARTWLAGAASLGLVLINTLRRPGPRLDGINHAVQRCVEVGGLELVRDLYGPLIFSEDWLAQNRAMLPSADDYTPIDRNNGYYRLLRDCRGADWNLPYEGLKLPVLVITGLQDGLFLNLDDVKRYSARLPDGRRVDFADAGHMVPVERPQRFVKELLSFAAAL